MSIRHFPLKRKVLRSFLGATFLFSFTASRLPAQSSTSPQAYSLTQVSSMFGPSVPMMIYRNGSQALIDESYPPRPDNPKGFHMKILSDLQTQKNYTWDLINTLTPCGAGNFSGDWGDPFASYAEITAELAKQNPKAMGKESINGIATNALEVTLPGGKGTAKLWIDEKDGLIIKYEMIPVGGSAQTILEVKQLSFDKPPASVFALPPACAGVVAATPAPTESQRIAAETGGNGDDFASAFMPPRSPSHSSCAVPFKIVRSGTMEPINKGFQVAIDVSGAANPQYNRGEGTDGRETFSGGGVRELTGQLRNGVLHVDSPPAHFDMQIHLVGGGGDADALIYRQCFAPETVLLLVVKNPAKLSDGADWLWVKSGKFAE